MRLDRLEPGTDRFDERTECVAHELVVALLVFCKPLAVVVASQRSEKAEQLGRDVARGHLIRTRRRRRYHDTSQHGDPVRQRRQRDRSVHTSGQFRAGAGKLRRWPADRPSSVEKQWTWRCRDERSGDLSPIMRSARVLTIDDSVVAQRLVADAMSTDAHLELVAVAHCGRAGLEKIPRSSASSTRN